MLFTVFVAISLLLCVDSSPNLSPNDIDILNELYHATNGPNWLVEYDCNEWDFSGDPNPCLSWCYLSCSKEVDSSGYLALESVAFYWTGLEGFLPESFFSLTSLISFTIYENSVYGTIAENINQWADLEELILSNTLMSGTLPIGVSNLKQLRSIDLSHNCFSGKLDSAFSTALQVNLREINLEDNLFTGTIPSSVFVAILQWLSLKENCFNGQLSSFMCESKKLQVLNLEAANANSRCMDPFITIDSHYYMIPLSQSFLIRHEILGPIPKCLFELPFIEEIALNSLGIGAALPENVAISPSLTSIDLSFNALHGTIPAKFQRHPFERFFLYNNRLKGTLLPDIDTEMYSKYSLCIKLTNNRLSEVVPKTLLDAETDILEGNSFSCLPSRDDLPKNDPYYSRYQCGSREFNLTLAGSCTIVFVFLLLLLIAFRIRDEIYFLYNCFQLVKRFMNAYANALEQSNFAKWNQFSRIWTVVLCGFSAIFLIPTYVGLSVSYATQTYKYAWIVSGVYLSGVVPTVILLIVIILVGLTALLSWYRCKVRFTRSSVISNSFSWKVFLIWFVSCIILIVIDVGVVVGVNIRYVFDSRQPGSDSSLQYLSLAMTIFKIVWNFVVIRTVLKWINQIGATKNDPQSRWLVTLEVILVLFNNIMAPFIGTLFAIPLCLQSAFTMTTLPFLYSYQCSSAYITTYSSVFLFMLVFTSVATPLSTVLLTLIHGYCFTNQNVSLLFQFGNVTLYMLQPRILHPNLKSPEWESSGSPIVSCFQKMKSKRWFNADMLVVDYINMFAIMLTFGVVVPPVAIVGCAAILSYSWFNELVLGRGVWLVQSVYNECVSENFLAEVINECILFEDQFMPNLFLMVPFVAAFYGLLLFDMLGDTEGAVRASWAPVVVTLILVTMAAVARWGSFSRGEEEQEPLLSNKTEYTLMSQESSDI